MSKSWSAIAASKTPTAAPIPVIKPPAPSPTVAPTSAQTLMPPPAPPLAAVADPTMAKISAMGDYLDRSEGRGGVSGTAVSKKNPAAHARAEHVGRGGAALESRGKAVDGAFMTKYDQDKALAMMLSTSAGAAAQASALTKKGEVVDTNLPKPADKPWMTAPLVRQAVRQADGSYEHFNAKVNRATAKFSKDTGMAEGARVQTLYGSDVTPLPKPLPGGTAPTDRVQLDSITDTAKLRKTTTEVKDSTPLGRVVDRPKAHAPVASDARVASTGAGATDTAQGEVVAETEGGGTEVGGVPSEGVSSDKAVELAPAPAEAPVPAAPSDAAPTSTLSKSAKRRMRKAKAAALAR